MKYPELPNGMIFMHKTGQFIYRKIDDKHVDVMYEWKQGQWEFLGKLVTDFNVTSDLILLKPQYESGICLVEWYDTVLQSEWSDEIPKLDLCKSVGWLTEGEGCKILVQSKSGEGDFSGVMAIPNGCIVKVTEL